MRLRNVGECFNTGLYQVQPCEEFDLSEIERRLHESAREEEEASLKNGAPLSHTHGLHKGFNARRECRHLLTDYPGRFLPKDDEATQIYEAIFPELPPPYQEKYKEAHRLERRREREQQEG